MKEEMITVENIKCQGCINSITEALLKVNGVGSVIVDKENETVSIVGKADREKLVKVLSGLGYPERGGNSLFLKARSVVSCATGKFQP